MPPTQTRVKQEAYLEAMGVEVWRLRDAASEISPESFSAPQLKLSPGSGGTLLICTEDTDSVSRLANDINRALGGVPVWGWPQNDGVELIDVVEENLFTTIAVFGQDLAAQLFGADIPVSLNSAQIVLLPGMRDISNQAESRRSLWNTLCRSGMVSCHDNNA
jgi:DNA polymerase III psi subunit